MIDVNDNVHPVIYIASLLIFKTDVNGYHNVTT